MYDFHWKENGKIKLCIIVGTRPEISRLAATIKRCREYFDCCVAHTGQNYDKNLNDVFWADFDLGGPDVYLNVVGENLGQTCGNVIARSYELMAEIKPDALLILGDTNSCLSAISAKRLHIPIFHMEAGNRCKDECLPEETNRRIVDVISDVNLPYSEPARKYLHERGMPTERTYVTGSPMAEVLRGNLKIIEASHILSGWAWKRTSTSFSLPTGKRTSTRTKTLKACSLLSTLWRKSTMCPSSTPATPAPGRSWKPAAFNWIPVYALTNPWALTITTSCK